MEIKTELNLGEKVWFLYDNKIKTGRIDEITCSVNGNGEKTEKYRVAARPIGGIFKEEFWPTKIFNSKQEVIYFINNEKVKERNQQQQKDVWEYIRCKKAILDLEKKFQEGYK